MEKLYLPISFISFGIVILLIAITGMMGPFSVYLLVFGTIFVIAGFHFWKKNLSPSS